MTSQFIMGGVGKVGNWGVKIVESELWKVKIRGYTIVESGN